MTQRSSRNDQIVCSYHPALLAQDSKETCMDTRCFRSEIQYRQLRQNSLDKGRAARAPGVAIGAMHADQ